MSNQQASLAEITKKGQEIYDEKLKNELEPEYNGKFVVIEVESEEYFVDESLEQALEKAKKKFPDKVFYSTRIGYPGVFTFSKVGVDDSNYHWFS